MAIAKTESTIQTSTTINTSGSVTSSALDCSSGVGCTITANLTFNASATAGATLGILSSPDDTNYDTLVLDQVSIPVSAGATVQVTLPVNPSVKYLKAKVSNLDAAYTITAVTIVAVLTTA